MKTITQDQYYQLIGLMAAYTEQSKVLRSLEKAALVITDERDRDGNVEEGGHTWDILCNSRELDDGLRIMGIEVQASQETVDRP